MDRLERYTTIYAHLKKQPAPTPSEALYVEAGTRNTPVYMGSNYVAIKLHHTCDTEGLPQLEIRSSLIDDDTLYESVLRGLEKGRTPRTMKEIAQDYHLNLGELETAVSKSEQLVS